MAVGDNDGGFTPGRVVRVLELAVHIGPVQHHKTARVAGAQTEDHSGLGLAGSFKTGVEFGRIFLVLDGRKAHQGFTVGQHGLFGRGGGPAQQRGRVVQAVQIGGRIGPKEHAGAFLAGSQHAVFRGQFFQPAKQGVGRGKAEAAHDSSRSLMFGSST